MMKEFLTKLASVSKSKKRIYALSLVGVISLVVVIALIYYIYRPATQTIKSTTITPYAFEAKADANVFYYKLVNQIYRYDVSSQQIVKLGIQSTKAIVSEAGNLLVYMQDDDTLMVYDVARDIKYTPPLTKPKQGKLNINTPFFSQDGSKLVFQQYCTSVYDKTTDSYLPCDANYAKDQTGLFYYDLQSGVVKKIQIAEELIQSIHGWSVDDANTLVYTKTVPNSAGGEGLGLYTINVVSNEVKLVKSVQHSGTVQDIDSKGNILVLYSDDSKSRNGVELYYNDTLIQKAGLMQLRYAKFTDESGQQISYVSESVSEGINAIKVINTSGELVAYKEFPSDKVLDNAIVHLANRYLVADASQTVFAIKECQDVSEALRIQALQSNDGAVRPQLILTRTNFW
jgi:hypothetical protein